MTVPYSMTKEMGERDAYGEGESRWFEMDGGISTVKYGVNKKIDFFKEGKGCEKFVLFRL